MGDWLCCRSAFQSGVHEQKEHAVKKETFFLRSIGAMHIGAAARALRYLQITLIVLLQTTTLGELASSHERPIVEERDRDDASKNARSSAKTRLLNIVIDSKYFGECWTFDEDLVRAVRERNSELQCGHLCELGSDPRNADVIVVPAHKVGQETDLYGANWERGVVFLNQTSQQYALVCTEPFCHHWSRVSPTERRRRQIITVGTPIFFRPRARDVRARSSLSHILDDLNRISPVI